MKKLLIVLAIMLIPTATSALTLATEDHWECGNIEEGLYFFTLEHSMMDARMPYYLCCCGEKMDHQAMLLNYVYKIGTLVSQKGGETTCGRDMEILLNADPKTPEKFLGKFYSIDTDGNLTEMECPCKYVKGKMI